MIFLHLYEKKQLFSIIIRSIKNFRIQDDIGDNFIFIYKLINSKQLNILIKKIKEKYKYKIYLIDYNVINQIQKFIYGVYNCRAVITDSFHGTIFSIIFNKPFISFVYILNALSTQGGKIFGYLLR